VNSTARRQQVFTREIIKAALAAIAEEMFAVQRRTSMSPVIYEVLDFACGLCDADGELVVIHDDDVARTTNGPGRLASYAFAALRRLDAGDGQSIPTLGEVLDAVPHEVAVNVELKGAATAEPVARLLGGLRRPLLVSSFDHDELGRFHDLLPKVPCAPLASRWRPELQAVAQRLGAWSVHLADRIASPTRIAAVRGWGRRCLVYTVNDPARARQLQTLGVAGVFTDYPDRVRRDASRRPPAVRTPGPECSGHR